MAENYKYLMGETEMDGQREFPFEFSVVMAVYNVEPFLREAVDSLIAQNFGFEKIQLIMVDDGSTDGSGAICDEYAERYPKNVMVVHKENGGVSSARNEGLKHIQGRYINFMDSDDKLSGNAMSIVWAFFQKHKDETDIVALPMYFFDGARGGHILNGKFKKGSRVIQLLQEWQTVQLSCSSAFFSKEVVEKMRFDTNLAYCEDGKEIQKILIDKMTLGVVKEASYQYRRRSQGASSAVQSAENNIQWYIPYLKYFVDSVITECLERKGYIPKFVQYSIMYHLQWRFMQKQIPNTLMTDKELLEYQEYLYALLKYFDDDVIIAQKDIQTEHKAHLLKKKYGREADILWGVDTAILHYQNTYLCSLGWNKTHLDFISMTSTDVCLEGYVALVAENYGEIKIFVEVNGEKVQCIPIPREKDRYILNEPIFLSYGFKCEIPIDPTVSQYEIGFFCEICGRKVKRNRLSFGKFCPISAGYQNSYFYCEGYMLTTRGAKLYVKKCGHKDRSRRESLYLKELLQKNKRAERKAVFARMLIAILKPLKKGEIWIISDRADYADDNGEAFFQYISSLSQKNIKSYFTISSRSPDYKRLKKIGKVVPFLGIRHKILYLLADCIISSQADEHIFRPFQQYSGAYRDLAQSQKFVFLQHGVTKDDMSTWLNRYDKNIQLFVTVTVPEYESILNGKYYYNSDVVKLTGFPRYDRLYRQEKKVITIMPTWRAYLVTGINPKTGKRGLKSGYWQSNFFVMYNELLNCQRLFDCAQEFGYSIAFMHHPNMASAEGIMDCDSRLLLLGQDVPYRTVFAESDLLVTDYSSVAFDFAYLRKPVIYYQMDKDEFFSGAHTYEKGYFDYEKDGFGEVEYSVEALVDRIIEYMKNDCSLKEMYRERIDATFPFSDQNNCQRVYEEILRLDERKALS